jgi:hypothetical protein
MRVRNSVNAAMLVLLSAAPLLAQPRPAIDAHLATSPPRIDGVIGEREWGEPIAAGDWLSYNPLYGDRVPQQTTVWISYDADALYFAFRCDDPEPANIKTSITRRDNIWQDDWIGLSLDALGTGQLSYHMMVNPSGVQADMLNSAAGGEDTAPDWIWDSAGRLTATGYVVEIRLPLQSIRFSGGANTSMGILFWRRVSRLGVSVSWPALAPGVWVFERHAALRFADLRPRPPREVLPSVTYGRTETHERPDDWTVVGRGDVGFGGKIGLGPTITLDATVNPDFSQVESDAFQVEVNQRFPTFFGEKRPFFMEGAGIFALAGSGNGDNSLRTAVHTRRIVDPIFGAKLTGSVGRVTFGTLSSVDEAVPANAQDPAAEGSRVFNIGRVQYSLGPSNYAGAIATDMTSGDGYNRVVGADLRWRLASSQRLDAFALASRTKELPDTDATSGVGAQVTYSYETQKLVAIGSFEHYDPQFRMETAFINRVGITSGWGFIDRSFYPDKTKYPWIRRVGFLSFTQGGSDFVAGGNDFLEVVGMRFNFTRQGFLRVDRTFGFEHWRGEPFDRGRLRAFGNVQLYRWLYLEGNVSGGLSVFYDPVDPFQGRSRVFNGGVRLQPNGRLQQSLFWNRVAFDDDATGLRVYTVHIVNARTTYQFTRAFSLRGIAQYDSSRYRILGDALFSYEPRPGTVVYAGYGSLIEQREFVDEQWTSGAGVYAASRRGLFFKTSYLHRF